MNISRADTNSEIYKQFIGMLNQKVSIAVDWLVLHKIDYIWNYWIGSHLYRIYIPSKDLLLDFEYYPVNNTEYNYIRVNFDTDMIWLMERIFPQIILDTQELTPWKLNQKASNKFLKENNVSPIYDKNVLRIAYVKDTTIYQCIIIKNNKILANVTKRDCAVKFGTYMLLRYLNECFGIPEILIKASLGDSYPNSLYQTLGLPVISVSDKKKIWWNPDKPQWKIKKELTSQYVPFYYCEDIVYRYYGYDII